MITYFAGEHLAKTNCETHACQKKLQGCVHTMCCVCKENPCKGICNATQIFVSFVIFVRSVATLVISTSSKGF